MILGMVQGRYSMVEGEEVGVEAEQEVGGIGGGGGEGMGITTTL